MKTSAVKEAARRALEGYEARQAAREEKRAWYQRNLRALARRWKRANAQVFARKAAA